MADPEQQAAAGSAAGGDDDMDENDTGYRVGAKVSVDELLTKDADDDALNRWKAQLLAGAAAAAPIDPNDTRVVIIEEFGFIADGRDPIAFDFSTPEGVEAMKNSSITIKEGSEYNLRVRFRVQRDTVLGLRFNTVVKRSGLKVDTQSHMIGSYAPTPAPVEFMFPSELAPSGMMARGKYKATSRFIDDDKRVHLEWEWGFSIKKTWGDDE
eukprot:a346178_113.p2 GENE.a346178_113~~a346178_113.p2  ORF type:complete len:221 (+),score=103.15 a346178_113:32-664(+)